MYTVSERNQRKCVPILGKVTSTFLTEVSIGHKSMRIYVNLCIHDRLSSRQLERQIDSALYERSLTNNIKLSPVMRELAPQAEHVFRDQYVLRTVELLLGSPRPRRQEAQRESQHRRTLMQG